MLELNKTLNKHFEHYEIFVEQNTNLHENYIEENKSIIETYLSNKKLEGLSPRTLTYYGNVIYDFVEYANKHLSDVTSQDIREYLSYRCGFYEIYTYPWIDEKYIRAANITEAGLSLTDVLEMEFKPAETDKYLLQS